MPRLTSLCTAFFVLAFIICFAQAGESRADFFGKGDSVTPKGNEILLKTSDITAKGSYYNVNVDGVKVVFFAVRDTQGGIRVALDACDSCFPAKKGYTQDKDVFVCNNCSMRFHVNNISRKKGGCNPHPISSSEKDGMLVIPFEEIKQGVSYFK